MLLAALEMGDYAKVKKFAGYLEDLTADKKAPVKRGRRPKVAKAADVVKVPKKRGRPARAKTVAQVAVEVEKAKKPAETAKKAKSVKKAPSVKKVKAPQPEPVVETTAEAAQK